MHPKESSGLMLVVSGPAGSGKTTVCDRMLAHYDTLGRVITSTSRDPREGEQHGVDYYFFPPEQFREMIDNGEFYEHAQVHGRYYGSLKREIDAKLAAGVDLLLNVDVQGAATYRQASRENEALRGRVVTVFIQISPEQVRERLEYRQSDDEAEIERRIQTANKELEEAPLYDHVIISGTREEDFARLAAIYEAERKSRA
ncbi:guanylate kinase [Cerasicoccus fimbriatus]|uniref:guanylate kinase n=1 Tax=Cerasicoccus fimbriatus TaxID=3014554 RepID=UPI0022B4DE85|nr:guanylate kinase [Cerasicoccus sp. TK19100]